MESLDSSIHLPQGPIKQFQIECNAPLNCISARVEREPSFVSSRLAAAHSSILNTSATSDTEEEQAALERIFFPLPRAHETAVSERERTLRRIDEKQNRLQSFLQQTKARVMASEDSLRELAKAEAAIAHEKTKRRLNQSVGLIPKPTATLNSKRVVANPNLALPGGKARTRGAARAVRGKSAKDIAVELGVEVVDDLVEVQKARLALLSHKRKEGAGEGAGMIISPNASRIETDVNSPDKASPKKEAEAAVFNLNATLLDASRVEVWEGEMKHALREKKAQQVVYSEIRKSLMSGERARVREARKEREEEEIKGKQELEIKRRREEETRIRLEAEERLEKLRQQNVLKSLAARLAEEREIEARLIRPKQQLIESSRFTEALRHRLLDAINDKKLAITPLCPCVPARSVADNRIHLCASNCPLRNNWKAYNRLISDQKVIVGLQD